MVLLIGYCNTYKYMISFSQKYKGKRTNHSESILEFDVQTLPLQQWLLASEQLPTYSIAKCTPYTYCTAEQIP